MSRKDGSEENIHAGHRKRLRERFLSEGLDAFEEHNVMELLLFYALPRGDTNVIAHELIKKFGSVAGVFDASYDEITAIDGVGESAALLIKLIPELFGLYSSEKSSLKVMNTPEEWGNYLLPYFLGRSSEVFMLLCLDGKGKPLQCTSVCEGSTNSTSVGIRDILRLALRCKCVSAVIAHNHPGGIAMPSPEDLIMTEKIEKALAMADIKLLDHIIAADGDFVSLRQNGFLK